MNKKKLVIVESSTKAKTIKKYLGYQYDVISTTGHLIDLPKSRLAVNIDLNFQPDLITVRGKGKILNEIKTKASRSSAVLIASDNDREGEAIAFNLHNYLLSYKPFYSKNISIKRIVFNEITKNSIKNSVKMPMEINLNKVEAQKARRVLDRLVGFGISPVLWELRKGLSAGRVQSATLLLICLRDQEIKDFKPEEYWDLSISLNMKKYKLGSNSLTANLYKYDNKKVKVSNKSHALELKSETLENTLKVKDIKLGSKKASPPPPLITSSMQRAAFNVLGFKLIRTMKTAQSMYEGVNIGKDRVGLITYIRTDSLRVSKEALGSVRSYISESLGDKYLEPKARVYKNRRSAQDAHEAIRPTDIRRTPLSIKDYLEPDQFKLYSLIWNTFVSSQMTNAVYSTQNILFESGKCLYSLNHSTLKFDGYLSIYKTKSSKITNEDIDFTYIYKVGDSVDINKFNADQKFTKPPAKYNSSSIIKTIESSGIGRPSTYAPTIATLVKRNYIEYDGTNLQSTELGNLVNKTIGSWFNDVINIDFTASLEDKLDSIEDGKINWVPWIKEFYTKLLSNIESAKKHLENLDVKIDKDKKTDFKCPKCNEFMWLKFGRFGEFLACSKYPDCKTTMSIPLCNCPNLGCNGSILKKKSKVKYFYSCNKYPDCDFVYFGRPTKELCDLCKSNLFAKSKKKNICRNKDCKRYE